MKFTLSDEVVNFLITSFATPNEAIDDNKIHNVRFSNATIISALIVDTAPEIKQIKINGEKRRSSSNILTERAFKLLKKVNNGLEVSFGKADKPKPAKIEPVITFKVWPFEASEIILVGTRLFQKLTLVKFSVTTKGSKETFISVTSNINLPIDNLPSGDKIPGVE